MTFSELSYNAINELIKAGINDAKVDASLLINEVFGVDRGFILAHGDEEISSDKYEVFNELLARRVKREPLQHILGYQEFMGLRFKVNKDVLVPRFDTEVLVEETLKHLHDGMRILDMCTGSGCILTSLLYYSNECTGVGVDISEAALNVARDNAYTLLKDKVDVKCSYVNSNLFDKIPKPSENNEFPYDEKFDIIISNPPYIESEVIATLDTEVKDYDPYIALDGGKDGLMFYRSIINSADDYLKNGGLLIFEIGYNQGSAVSDIMNHQGFTDVNIVKDYAGYDRVVMGRIPFVV